MILHLALAEHYDILLKRGGLVVAAVVGGGVVMYGADTCFGGV